MYCFASDEPVDVDELRERFRRVTDDEILAYGNATQYMCSPKANCGRTVWLVEPDVNPVQLRPYVASTAPTERIVE